MTQFRNWIVAWYSLYEPVRISRSLHESVFELSVYQVHSKHKPKRVWVFCYRLGSHERVRNTVMCNPTHTSHISLYYTYYIHAYKYILTHSHAYININSHIRRAPHRRSRTYMHPIHNTHYIHTNQFTTLIHTLNLT